MTLILDITIEEWALIKPFRISRMVHRVAPMVHVVLSDGEIRGAGEAVGVSYKGETPESIRDQIEAVRAEVEAGIDRAGLQKLLGPGGARNALDCALWDMDAKKSGKSIWQLLDRKPHMVTTVYTVGIDSPEKMADDARAHSGFPVLKIKVGDGDLITQLKAIGEAAPGSGFILDANEAWSLDQLATNAKALLPLRVKMIEQPLKAGEDEALIDFTSPIPLCADESCQDASDLGFLEGRYEFVNIKLDKTGGLTAALELAEGAKSRSLKLMVGNMLGTSLGMAPAYVIAQDCLYSDLDGPLLQAQDREHAIRYRDGLMSIPCSELWG